MQKLQLLSLQGGNKLIDNNSPIIPWVGLGGVKLYSHVSHFYDLIDKLDEKSSLLVKLFVRYEIKDSVDLWFNLLNGKLFKITASKGYNGLLFDKIHIGMHIDEVLQIEPSFEYDDFEEVYVSPKGCLLKQTLSNKRYCGYRYMLKN